MESTTSSLHQIKNLSLREQALEIIRKAIFNGTLRPEQPLTETDLASQLGISRAPVREALRTLNAEGLVETVPYHGTSVRKLGKTDIEELYSLRIQLETFAIRRIIEQNNPEHAANLRMLYQSMIQAGQSNNLQLINQLDQEFHNSLIEMSNHNLLMSIWQGIALRVRWVMAIRNTRNTDLTQIAHNHLPVIDAIEAGNCTDAVSLLEKHITSMADLITEDWEDLEP